LATLIRDGLNRVLNEYRDARQRGFASHALASFIRRDLPAAVDRVFDDSTRYKCVGSPGKGNWAGVPWVAMFDTLITETAESGYYPVFLFREDMSGVYLSLNQGVTEVEAKYKSATPAALRVRAEDFRLQLGQVPANFPEVHITLVNDTSYRLGKLYEAGNVIARLFARDQIPPEEELEEEIRHMKGLYGLLSYNETIPIGSGAREADESADAPLEELRRFRQHKRIERNPRVAKEVKKVQGVRCQVCLMTFEDVYGSLGKDFIEAHHLKPVALLPSHPVLQDPLTDFAVLCSNCHSMIHRMSDPGDIEALRRVLRARTNS